MAGLSNPDRLRLAVAIAVLRSKPSDVSIPSYVLGLHPNFPPSGPAPPSADRRWRTYALKLESDLEQLKEKYMAQETELLASNRLSSDTASSEVSAISSTAADSIKKKIKGKKTPGASASDVKFWSDLGNFQQIDIPIPRSGELFLALRAFGKVISGNHKDTSTLLHSMLRVIQIASRILTSIIDQSSSKTSNSVTVSVLGKILSYTITTSLTSMTVQRQSTTQALVLSDIDKVFDALIECIFGPIILAFRKISHASLSTLVGESSFGPGGSLNLEKPSPNMESADLRQDLLGLFKMLVDNLHSVSLPQDHLKFRQWTISLSSLKACLSLEIIRELGKVLFPEAKPLVANGSDTELGNSLWNQGTHALPKGVPLTVPASASLAASVAYVVAKDVLWYLCNLMHILADLPEGSKPVSDVLPSATPQESKPFTKPGWDRRETMLLELLHDAVLSALYDLALKCQSIVDCDKEGPCSELDTFDEMQKTHVGNSLTTDRHHSRRENGLLKGDKESAQNSQAQGRSSSPSDIQSEVGDPGGSGLRVRLDDTTSALVGCSGDGPDSRFGNTYRRSTDGDDTNTPEVEAPLVGVSMNCFIDEGGFTMLLGVVERYILGSGYTKQ